MYIWENEEFGRRKDTWSFDSLTEILEESKEQGVVESNCMEFEISEPESCRLLNQINNVLVGMTDILDDMGDVDGGGGEISFSFPFKARDKMIIAEILVHRFAYDDVDDSGYLEILAFFKYD